MLRVLMPTVVLLLAAVPVSRAQVPGTPPSPAAPASASSPAQRPPVSAASATATPADSLTDEQKTVYALGLLLHRSIRQFDLSQEEIEILKRALIDSAAGTPAIDLNEWGPKVEPFANARGVRATTREKEAGAAYLDQAARELGAVRTTSGLVYRDISVGTGPAPTAGSTVKVNYRGSLINGTVFDSSYERNEPAVFALSGVIGCWTEGVQRMRVGGKARLVCPSSLAYGDGGSPAIPGGAALVFEVELLEIMPPMGMFPRN